MISIAHSPDADDFFLFWPLREKLIDCGGFEFRFTEMDTEQLNQAAIKGEYDICAISVAAYPLVAKDYLILPTGASVGRSYGPVVVSKKLHSLSELTNARVAVPGETTTAAALFSKFAPSAKRVEAPLTPFERVFELLDSNAVDAAVLIHEGQIAFAERGFHKLLDLGRWWFEETKLPLPLGINVIKRTLRESEIQSLTALTVEAARFARANIEEILPALFEFTQTRKGKLKTLPELRTYLQMYANEDSLDLPEDCRDAIARLCRPACEPEYATA